MNIAMSCGAARVRTVAAFLVAAFVALPSVPVGAIEGSETDPRKIMQAVEDRDDGDREVSRIVLTVTDGSGRTITRTVVGRSLDFDEGTYSLMQFDAPADMRNTGLLSIDYESGSKDDDQWLYLPALHKSTRVSSADKSGSFLGTDLTYSDMTSRDVDSYDYKLLAQSEDVDGEDCWVIEARPRTEKEAEETGYVKSQLWISKAKLLPLQSKHWVREGRKIKYVKLGHISKVDGIWVARRMHVRVVQGGKLQSTTTLEMKSIQFGVEDVKRADFTQRRLEQGL